MQSYQQWIWQAPTWPALNFSAEELQTPLSEARQSVGILLGKAQAIGLERLQPQILEAMTQEAMTTSSIEGEKLDPSSVRSSIARRLGLDNHGAPPSESKRNIEGLLDVMQDATNNLGAELTLERLCGWHAALFPSGFSGMHRIDVGVLRSKKMEIVSGSIGHQKVHYEAPPAQDLEGQVQRFLDWFNETRPKTGKQPMDGLIRCAVSHLWFETLHPFDDGNGRIGRAILQLAMGDDLGQSGRVVTLSRQIESCKNQYYLELEKAQKSNHMDITPWVDWMIRQIKHSADFASETIDVSLQRIHFQTRMAAFALNDRQLKTMKKLLDAGPNGFIGGMTTKKHQSICQTSTPTAARDLIELESLGLLCRQGAGRSTRYYPAIEEWSIPLAVVAHEALEELQTVDPTPQDDAIHSRVDALPRLQQQAGAAYTLHQVVSKALQGVSGDANAVDWDQVHKDVFAKAVGKDQQPAAAVLEAIKKHSPGAVTPEQIATVEALGESRKVQTSNYMRTSEESIQLDAEVEAIATYIGMKWEPIANLKQLVQDVRDAAEHAARVLFQGHPIWEVTVAAQDSRVAMLEQKYGDVRPTLRYYDVACQLLDNIRGGLQDTRTAALQMDGAWDYEHSVNKVLAALTLKYPNLVGTRPNGWAELEARYVDFDGQEEYDARPDCELFKGAKLQSTGAMDFVHRTALPYVMYDDKCQGREAEYVLVGAMFSHFSLLTEQLNTRSVCADLEAVIKTFPQELVFDLTIDPQTPVLQTLVKRGKPFITRKEYEEAQILAALHDALSDEEKALKAAESKASMVAFIEGLKQTPMAKKNEAYQAEEDLKIATIKVHLAQALGELTMSNADAMKVEERISGKNQGCDYEN